jgi:propionyl-CoA carboxylase alpha chain
MIRVAAGEKLALRQQDVKLDGWAIESRIYAEDPYRSFLPSIGRLVRYRPPEEASADGITVRNDTGVYEGGEISLHYDPMIAKLVTHAPTRAEAIEAQSDALDAFVVDGVQHNIPFLAALMAHPRWRAGRLSTGFIAEEYPGGFHARLPEGEIEDRLVAVAAAIDHRGNERKRRISGQANGKAVMFDRTRIVRLGERELMVEVEGEGDTLAVRFRDRATDARQFCMLSSAWRPGLPVWSGLIDDAAVSVQVRPILNGVLLSHRGVEARAHVYTAREAAAVRLMPEKTTADSGKRVLCPMPGLVVSIAVSEGQEVKAGETLAVVEAMKMENVLRAERDGTVKKIHAKPGETLAVDAVILEFE